jgi:isopentenyl-diphosphate delta-isomerase type 1
MEELVVLVDEQNTPLGTAPKDTVHTAATPLHRGFSVFIFNSKGDLLITKRADTKKTFPGVWSNTACGHPAPGESAVDAAKRRLKAELGLDVADVAEVAPYRYRFADRKGIVENEICPVLVGHADVDPAPVVTEASEWKWMKWEDFLADTQKNPGIYSPWSIEEAVILQQKGPASR